MARGKRSEPARPHLDRRQFLGAAAGALGAVALGGCEVDGGPIADPFADPPATPPGVSGPWGTAPEANADLVLGEGDRAERVLEVFLHGGLGPFESFYVVEDYGRPTDPEYANQQWHLYADQHAAQFACTGLDQPDWLQPFATDANGKTVAFGPATAPLRARSDLMARLRVLVQAHDAEPHEAAIPLALSGQRLGSPRMAGLGVAVQRFHQERGDAGRVVPSSFVLYSDTVSVTDNLRAASTVGLHPASARPLSLRIDGNPAVVDLLQRPGVGDRRQAHDALVAHLLQKEQRRLMAAGTPLRSRAMRDYASMTTSLSQAAELSALIPPELVTAQSGEVCGAVAARDLTGTELRLAAHLLTHPTHPARHVTVVDSGLVRASGGGAFDTHEAHLRDGTINLMATLQSLTELINEPGEDDPNKIDLDTTLVIINTEFGRTPTSQFENGTGTNHHPYGYVTLMLGGPLGEDQAGVLGALGPDGVATQAINPTEARCAALAAMGIYPFTNESFAVGDVNDETNERDGLAWLTEHVLGRSVG